MFTQLEQLCLSVLVYATNKLFAWLCTMLKKCKMFVFQGKICLQVQHQHSVKDAVQSSHG